MTTTTSSKSYANVSTDDLNFTAISAAETDVVNGSSFVESFTGNSGDPTSLVSGSEIGMSWSGITMTTASDGTGASQTVTITYDVAETGSNYITAIDSLYNIDIASGGASFTAVESIANTSGVVLGTQSFTYGTAAPAPAQLSMGVQNAVVTLTLTETASATNSEVSASVLSQLFAETPGTALAALGDYVWMDTNDNGLQDSTETGVAGVTVDLLNAAGTSILAVTTTNSSGLYHFTGLLPGVYDVKFVSPIGESFTTTSQGTNTAIDSNANQTTGLTAQITLTAGQTDNTIDAGLTLPHSTLPAALGDFVWFDTNSNGLQDSTETGVAGVTVDLLDSTGTLIPGDVTTTNASGLYSFTNLAPGTYEVQFIAPAGDNFTTTSQGANTAIDSNANQTTGLTAPITLTANQTDLTIDAGLVAKPPIPAALGDYVWFDTNSNGLQDSTETGVAGVTVDLLNAAGTSVLGVTTTNASGIYGFTNLAAGTYEVQFVAPAADNFTATSQGANTAIDSNANQTTGLTAPITLTAGQTDLTIDAGLVAKPPIPAALGDYVWFDTNSNGLQDSTETGVAGVTVDLLNAAGTSVLGVTTTNASGIYGFTNLAAGTYEVQFVAPAADNFTATSQGANRAIDSNANQTTGLTAPITLTAGQTDLTIDAGLVAKPPIPAALGDYVWFDTNSNGLQDSTETGVAGVTVDLLNAAGTSVLGVTTTNASGIYGFTNLAAGTYEVQFVAPAADNFTATSQGANRAIDSNANQTTGLTAPITLIAGQTDLTIDAGLVAKPPIPAALGDYVWFDTDSDGLQDSTETGVAGVTVDLLNAAGTSVLGVTTTNASGLYGFTNLAAGTYEVQFIAPAADNFTLTSQGTNRAIDSNANQTTGLTAPITLTAGQTDLTIDAGLVAKPVLLAALGDYVWFDTDKDGLQDTNETGVAGVTVDLLNAAGTSILAVTTTNSSGLYHFTNLAAGTYDVKFVAPTGDTFTLTSQGTNRAIDSNANQTTGLTAQVTLTAGQTDNTIDAGLVAPSGITVNKIPSCMVINACGQETYTFAVTNTGSTPVTNISIKDNIGTAANPDYITPTLITTGFNGTLAPGATIDYSVTTNPINDNSNCCGTVSHTCSGSNLGSGNTAWFSCSFTPTSTKDGTCYVFKGVQCNLNGGSSKGYSVDCPDAVVTFSSSCKQASTTYNASTNCWTTTLPANCSPGDVFLTGCPVTVPSGCSFSNSTASWSIADSGNNCGSSSVDWSASCQGYNSFNQNGFNGCSDYNSIGVKVCDNTGDYGNGGSCNQGYGFDNGGYSSGGNGGYGGWGGWGYNNNGWQGSSNDCAGTPENQYTSSSCGSSGNNNGYGGGNNFGGNNGCGYGGSSNTGGCGNGGSGSCSQTQVGATGVADTVTVTGTAGGTTVTASDTAEVIVLGSKSNVSTNGTAPTGSLTSLYGKAQTLEFTYNPSNTVSTKTTSIGSSTGSNSNSMAFIAITNNTNPKASGAQVYFEGTVSSGQKLYADASINSLTNVPNTGTAAFMSTVSGANIYADIYTSQAAFLAGAAPVQVDTYNTSGSKGMYFNDQIGSLKVVGYVGSTGGHLTT